MAPASIYSCLVGDSDTQVAIDHELAAMGATPDEVASMFAVMAAAMLWKPAAARLRPALLRPAGPAGSRPAQPGQLTPATPARPDFLQLHVHLIRRFGLPVGLRLGVGLSLDPRGVLAAGVKLGPLRVDPARGLVRAGLQLIQPRGAPLVNGSRLTACPGSVIPRASRYAAAAPARHA